MSNTKEAYCRLCAELKPLNKLTDLKDDKEICQEISKKLSRFNILMDFNENILPHTVCFECTISLERSFTFVTSVEQAQTALSHYILRQIKTDNSDLDNENTFHETPNGSKYFIKGECVVTDETDGNNGYSHENMNKNDCNNVEMKHMYDSNKENVEDVIINDSQNPRLDHEMSNNSVPEPQNAIVNESQNNQMKEYKEAETSQKDNIIVVEPNLMPQTMEDTEYEYSFHYLNNQIKKLATVPVNEIKITWKDMSWKCSLCGLLFRDTVDLTNHAMEKHGTCNTYQCIDCNGKKFRLNLFLKHVHHHRKYLHYSCYICYEKFASPRQARLHKPTHFNSFVCPGCNTCFPNNTELNNHVNTYYKNIPKPKARKESGKKDLTCAICNKPYLSKAGLNNHLLSHTDRKRDHICEICGKGFYLSINLKEHMILHSDARPYQCVICNFSFKTLSRLRYHADVHSGIKPFTCDQCGKCFRLKKQLNNHLKTHTDSLDYSCMYCNKKFRCSMFLKQHTLQHTGVKPYTCDICPREFTNWGNCNKHMKRKHGVDKAKRKQTPQGPHAVDPTTGDVLYPDMEKVLEWKKKLEEPMKTRKRGRSRRVKRIGSVECKEVTSESIRVPEESEAPNYQSNQIK